MVEKKDKLLFKIRSIKGITTNSLKQRCELHGKNKQKTAKLCVDI